MDEVVDPDAWDEVVRTDFGGCRLCANGILHLPTSQCAGAHAGVTVDRLAVEGDEDAGVEGDPDDEVVYDSAGVGWHVVTARVSVQGGRLA